MRNIGDHVSSILSGVNGVVVNRYGYTYNPHYMEYIVLLSSGLCRVFKERHLRSSMTGEVRTSLREKRKLS